MCDHTVAFRLTGPQTNKMPKVNFEVMCYTVGRNASHKDSTHPSIHFQRLFVTELVSETVLPVVVVAQALNINVHFIYRGTARCAILRHIRRLCNKLFYERPPAVVFHVFQYNSVFYIHSINPVKFLS